MGQECTETVAVEDVVLVAAELDHCFGVVEVVEAEHALFLVGAPVSIAFVLVFAPGFSLGPSEVSENSIGLYLSVSGLPLKLHKHVAKAEDHERNEDLGEAHDDVYRLLLVCLLFCIAIVVFLHVFKQKFEDVH